MANKNTHKNDQQRSEELEGQHAGRPAVEPGVKEEGEVTKAPESGEPEDRLVKSTRRLEKTQFGSGGDKTTEKDDVRKAPESGR